MNKITQPIKTCENCKKILADETVDVCQPCIKKVLVLGDKTVTVRL